MFCWVISGFFGFFYKFAQKSEEFLGFFSVSRILLGASQTLNDNHSD